MPRQFLTVTQDEIDLKIAEAIRARELEILAYDFEHEAHTEAAKKQAPNNPRAAAAYQRYRHLHRDQMIAAAAADGNLDVMPAIAALAAIDRAKHEIEAVQIERGKSENHLAHLLSQLPPERRAAAFAAARAKEEEEKAARLAR